MSTKFTITILAILLSTFCSSQTILKGLVTDAEQNPLLGANVLIQGTDLGTVTGIDGQFSLNLSRNAKNIVVSYIGYESQTLAIEEDLEMLISLERGILLEEAIVTALGITREKKSIGYAAQEVKGEDLSLSRETNIISSLSGKVAGIQVVHPSGASIGGSSKIRIRGSNGLNLNNDQPLFVVDGTPISNRNFSSSIYRGPDFGYLSQDINLDDIETLTVLKGPSATALYGSRAANGVVLIKTKKGRSEKGIGVSINTSTSLERVWILPEYQNEYAGGFDGTFQEYMDPIDGQTYKGLEYYADESWGPRIDGTTMYRPWWSWIPGENYGKQIPLTSHPNNVRDFFNTGRKHNNHIAISGNGEIGIFRLSYSNVTHKGVVPNSSLVENNISLNASLNLTEKLSVSTSLNFANTNGSARPHTQNDLDNSTFSYKSWFQRQLDMEKLKDYKNTDGSFNSWNIISPYNPVPFIWVNPYVSAYENFATDGRDRYFGNISLNYKFNDHLNLETAFRRDDYHQRIEKRKTAYFLSRARYSEFIADGREDNFDFLLKYSNQFRDFTFESYFGGALRKDTYHDNFAETRGGLSSPGLYNLEASVDRPYVRNYISNKKVRSIYGAISLGYKDFLYLGGTLRNDWSSALPEKNNSYLYPSVSSSLIFSELFKVDWLSFGKIGASFAQVGADTDPYQTWPTFDPGTSYGPYASFEIPNILFNADLKPALASSYEFGTDLRFLKNRLRLDLTYYREDNKDQIIPIKVPGTSGYDRALINAGNIRDSGVEMTVEAQPITGKDFNWSIILNMAKNKSEVIELADGIDNFIFEGGTSFSIGAPLGGLWGTAIGTDFKKINGIQVIREDGSYVVEHNVDAGTFLPDYTGGIINNIQYKGFELSAFIDFRIGGWLLSWTKPLIDASGMSPETAGLNDKGIPIRDPVEEGGGYKVEGVLETGEPYSIYVDPKIHFKTLSSYGAAYSYDASYAKLRELRLGYEIPIRSLKKYKLNRLNVSLFAQNIWMIHSKAKGLDPSEVSPLAHSLAHGEAATLPPVRSIGLALQIEF